MTACFSIRARMERGTSLPHASHPCADINADIARAGYAGGCCGVVTLSFSGRKDQGLVDI
ncbi:hypothetical protein I2750_14865, partial [Bacillus sp. PR5]|nr:hypothetical protein [Bacillus sp. PR5]